MVNCCNLLGAVLVSGFAETGIDAKYLSYGLVDNREPVARTSASLVVAEWVAFDCSVLDDLTAYGRKAGYTSRRGRWTELDPGISLVHSAGSLDWTLGWSAECHPGAMGHRPGDAGEATQFVNASIGVPAFCLEPTLTFERDIQRDHGTYLNLEIGHDFPLWEEDVTVRPSVGQGWGDCRRVGAYLTDDGGVALRRAGWMDATLKFALTWKPLESLECVAFLAVSDYIFDRSFRHAARRYEAAGRSCESTVLFGGVSVRITF